MVEGFGWMATSNAGPGNILVLVEAKALLAGHDGPDDDAVVAHRQMLLDQRVRAVDVCEIICIITHSEGNAEAEKFWLRFCRDCFANPKFLEKVLFLMLHKSPQRHPTEPLL